MSTHFPPPSPNMPAERQQALRERLPRFDRMLKELRIIQLQQELGSAPPFSLPLIRDLNRVLDLAAIVLLPANEGEKDDALDKLTELLKAPEPPKTNDKRRVGKRRGEKTDVLLNR